MDACTCLHEGQPICPPEGLRTCRPGLRDGETPTPLVTCQEITQHYKLNRQTFPLPHPNLEKSQETALRLAETNTFQHPIRLHRISSRTQTLPTTRYYTQTYFHRRQKKQARALPHALKSRGWQKLLPAPASRASWVSRSWYSRAAVCNP